MLIDPDRRAALLERFAKGQRLRRILARIRNEDVRHCHPPALSSILRTRASLEEDSDQDPCESSRYFGNRIVSNVEASLTRTLCPPCDNTNMRDCRASRRQDRSSQKAVATLQSPFHVHQKARASYRIAHASTHRPASIGAVSHKQEAQREAIFPSARYRQQTHLQGSN